MTPPLRLILEELIFSPIFFCGVFGLLYVRWRSISVALASARWWLFPVMLLFLSSDWCYQLVAYPLKVITPLSQKQRVDAIVVAAAGVHASGAPTHTSAIRAHAAGTLYLEGWAPLIIVSGGVTEPYTPPVEIKGIRLILRGMGVPEEAIVVETRSTNTFENGVESARLIKERGLNKVLLISHDYHLYRLMAVFEKQRVSALPYAANRAYPHEPNLWWRLFEWENFGRLQTVTHEYLGILFYKLANRI
jgi:uncharacterized SAM-binding protein YcdF (DUF218 family)